MRNLFENLFWFAIFLVFSYGCEEKIMKQFVDQNINPQCKDGAIIIEGTNYQSGLSLYLDLQNINVTETSSNIHFQNFTEIHFSSLQIKNIIRSLGTKQFLMFLRIESKNLTIDYLSIQQDRDYIIYGLEILFIHYSNNLSINNGLIQYQNQLHLYTQLFYLINIQQQQDSEQQSQAILNNFNIITEINNYTDNVKTTLIQIDNAQELQLNNFNLIVNLNQEQLQKFKKNYERIFFSIISNYFIKTAQFNNFSISIHADEFYPVFFGPLIQTGAENLIIKNFSISDQNALAQVLYVNGNDEMIIDLENISLHDSFILNNPFYIDYNQQQQKSQLSQQLITIFAEKSIVTISDLFISNVQTVQFQFFYLFSQDIKLTNINFSNDLNNKNINLKSCTQNQRYLSWSEVIFNIQTPIKLTIDTLNIQGLQQIGQNSMFVISIQNASIDIQNINLNIDTIVNVENSPLFAIFNIDQQKYIQNIYFEKIHITINAKSSQINLHDSSFLKFLDYTNTFNLTVKNYTVDVINHQENPDFIINANYGPFFYCYQQIQNTLIQKPSPVKLSNIRASNIRSSGSGGFGYFLGDNLQVSNSYFEGISSEGNGGAFNIETNQLIMTNTTFRRCSSDYFGGALYCQVKKLAQSLFNQVELDSNTALFGGGMTGTKDLQNVEEISYKNNFALLHGQNFSSTLDSIKIKRITQYNPQFQNDNQLNFIEVNAFNISRNDMIYNLEIKELHAQLIYFLEIEFSIDNQPILIQPNEMNLNQLSLTPFLLKLVENRQSSLNSEFELNQTSSFYFMMKFPEQELNQLTQIQVKMINFQINFNLFQNNSCSDGQIYRNNNCEFCDNFSVTNRNMKDKQTECITCYSDKLSDCYAYKSFVNKGFMRYDNYDLDKGIYECNYAPDNCVGGELYGDSNCKFSHVGPLCLESDINNSRGTGLFVRSNDFNSSECHNYSFNLSFFILQFFIGVFIIGILNKIINQTKNNNLDNIIPNQIILNDNQIEGQRLLINNESGLQSKSNTILNENDINYGNKELQSGELNIGSIVYFKLIIFQLQIIYVCSFYQMNGIVLRDFFQFQTNLYNPYVGSYFSYFKCFLQQEYPDSFSSSQKSIAIVAFFPFIFLITFTLAKLLFHTFYFLLKYIQFKYKKYKLRNKKKEQLLDNNNLNEEEEEKFNIICFDKSQYTNFRQLILFTLSILSIQSIEILLKGSICLSFQGYGNVTLGDLLLSCDNSEFQKLKYVIYINLMIFYFSLSFGLLLYFIYKRNKNAKQKVEDCFYQTYFTFLFQEYKDSAFYWEFARNFIRIMMILVIYLSTPSNNVIGLYIIPQLIIYYCMLVHYKPYKNNEYQKIEKIIIWSGIVLIFSYYVNTSSYFNGKSPGIFIQVVVFLANMQSFILFIYLLFQFNKHLFNKQFEKLKRCFQNQRN